MEITDAERMINWFPEASFVQTRSGSTNHVTGLPADAETVMAYNGPSMKLFVVSGTKLYDATGTASASAGMEGLSGLSNARFQYVNFTTPGGSFLIAVNGADTAKKYDGSTWANTAIISSATSSSFINVSVFKERLFFIPSASLTFYYMDAVEAIAGTAAAFPLGSLFAKAGYLMAAGAWTRDGGHGMDDFAVFVTSEGEVAVYSGSDPGDANDWALVGVYQIPKPLGRRCLQKFGGDLWVLTEAGVLPMSTVLSGIEPQSFLTDKINPAVADAVKMYRDNYGWQLFYAPFAHMLILNVPVKTGDKQEQYVMNTNTGAWCRFKGLYANCWEVFSSKLYFGGDTTVAFMEESTNDNGSDIDVDVKQAASNFGTARYKKFGMYKPFINADGTIPLKYGFNVDFNDRLPGSIPTPVDVSIPFWGTATWTPNMQWTGKPRPSGSWQSASDAGTYGSVRMRGAVSQQILQWNATAVTFEVGGLG